MDACDLCGSACREDLARRPDSRCLPDGVTAAVSCSWLPADSLASSCSPDVAVVAAGELAMCGAVNETVMAKKPRKTLVGAVVKDWFLDYHECTNVKHKWNMVQSWRRAQEMLPSLLKDVHEPGFCRWTHSDHDKRNGVGKKHKLNVAHLTLLGQVCSTVPDKIVTLHNSIVSELVSVNYIT